MSSLLTKNFRAILAKQVYNLLDVTANYYLPAERKSYVYAMIGKQLPWNSGTEVAPAPSQTDFELNNYFKAGIVAKQITPDNASLIVPRIDWEANTEYNTYESTQNFYVVNSKDQVFKCLANNSGTLSTDEPELTLSTTSLEEPYIETSDGYKWKYLYTFNSLQKQKFLSEEWMPVTYNKFVRASAEPGSIDIITITNSGNNYTNGPTQNVITITGDGTGAVLKANVSNNKVQNIIIQSRGNDYTYANLRFGGLVGNGASAIVSIAPHDGHGYDPVFELGATSIMFNVDFEGTENTLLPTGNDFREVTLIQNPFLYNTSNVATASIYTLYKKIKVSPGIGDYSFDETVYQSNNFEDPLGDATFTADVISFDAVGNNLYVNNYKGTLQENQPIRGFQSGAARVVNSVTEPTLDLYSGKILYISDKLPITRDDDQTERIRFILSF
jgi:hypothetical protein